MTFLDAFQLKATLRDLMTKAEGSVHEPQATVKRGKLRMRQSALPTVVDDLARLEILDKVRHNNSRFTVIPKWVFFIASVL